MRLDSASITLAVIIGLLAFLGFVLLINDNISAGDDFNISNDVNISGDYGLQLNPGTLDEDSVKSFSGASGDDIIRDVKLEGSSLKVQDYWDDFETILVDTEKFGKAADNGSVNLGLFGENLDVEITKISRLSGGKFCRYSGQIKGMPESKADFYLYDQLFSGSIETGNLIYNIAVTSEGFEEKTVHIVFLMDWEKDGEKNSEGQENLTDQFSPFLNSTYQAKGEERTGELPEEKIPDPDLTLHFSEMGGNKIFDKQISKENYIF